MIAIAQPTHLLVVYDLQRKDFMECPQCLRGEFRRTARKGFFERHIYVRFGYFPWKCPTCRFRTLLKSRGERTTDRTPSASPQNALYPGPERRHRTHADVANTSTQNTNSTSQSRSS